MEHSMDGIKSGDFCHENLAKNAPRKLSFYKAEDLSVWKTQVEEKFIELFGFEKIKANACEENFTIVKEEKRDGYYFYEFRFDSEVGATVPCYLLIPDTGKDKYPLAITMQGHSSGVHNSIGEIRYEWDKNYQPRGSFALQAVKNGFASLCVEQRAMGVLRSPRSYGKDGKWGQRVHMCAVQSLTAFALGRTVLGERVWDVKKALDVVTQNLSEKIDLDKILITGNSGGGTISYYAACFDQRIKYTIPSCSFCSFKSSILDIEHCACNYVPDIATWFEMEDFSSLIAPRHMTVVAGELDDIFPIDGVKESYDTAKKIFEKLGAGGNINMVTTPKNHWWCEDIVWKAIKETTEKLGWHDEK